MAAAQRKGQKVSLLEAGLCNITTIFLAGFLLGFGMTFLMYLSHTAPRPLKSHAPAAHRFAETCVKYEISTRPSSPIVFDMLHIHFIHA
jgi:hypothetical protein